MVWCNYRSAGSPGALQKASTAFLGHALLYAHTSHCSPALLTQTPAELVASFWDLLLGELNLVFAGGVHIAVRWHVSRHGENGKARVAQLVVKVQFNSSDHTDAVSGPAGTSCWFELRITFWSFTY